jgi:phosphoglycerol transferase
MQLWKADWNIPLHYYRHGDVFSHSFILKGIIDNGWYLQNPLVGMPTGLWFHDYPLSDNLHFSLMKLVSLFTPGYGAALNVYFILTFPLTTVTALFVFRRFRISNPPAMVGSLLFSFLPYHFIRGQTHLLLASYYLVPLMAMVTLWICQGKQLFVRCNAQSKFAWDLKSSDAIISLAVCVLMGAGGLYYAFFGGFLLLVTAAVAFLRHRTVRSLLTPGLLLVVLCLSVLLNLAPNFIYSYRHGANPHAVVRDPIAAEVYGLKITHLLLPINNHRISFLARAREFYDTRTAAPGEITTASLGLVGAFGFLFLIGWLVYRKMQTSDTALYDGLSLLTIGAVLLGTVGGFGSLFAFEIASGIRAYNRISIYIAFFAFFAVVLLLENLQHIWARRGWRRLWFYALLGLILVLGTLDQTSTSGHFVPPYVQLTQEYAADRAFIERIEAQLPRNAMVFQLPYVPFPEQPGVFRMTDYDHLRGYLHSKALRWSYGAMKGREGDQWQRDISTRPPAELLEALAISGFRGIYVDRYGYSDNAARLEAQLFRLLGTQPMVRPDGRLAFFDIGSFSASLPQKLNQVEWQRPRGQVPEPVMLDWLGGFSVLEGTPQDNWRWCSSKGDLSISNPSRRERVFKLEMTVSTGYLEPSQLHMSSPWFDHVIAVTATGQAYSKVFALPPGRHVIRFQCNGKRVEAPGDPRTMVFRVHQFQLTELAAPEAPVRSK